MRESIHKYFKVGTILWMSYPPVQYGFLEPLKKILRDDYFDAIEVKAVEEEMQREEARALLAQAHMTVCYGAQPGLLGRGLNPNSLVEEERKEAEKLLLAAVDEAEYLGAKGIAFLSGAWSAETRDQAFEQLKKTTLSVCRHAAAKNMSVNLEVFDYDMDKKALIGPAPYAARFASEIRCCCSNFGLLVDLSHFPTTYETSRFVIQTLRPYITHLHIGNAVVKEGGDGYGDKHPRFGYPDSANDTTELLQFFRVLKEEGFFRKDDPMVLSFEVTLRPGEDGDIILANTKRVINRAWALLED